MKRKINRMKIGSKDLLMQENSELRTRLEEAEETLRAIREGEVDAVIVSGSKGDRVFSLVETDNLYHLMVDTMNEAGIAVSPDGTLLFCNDRACFLLQRSREQLLGRSLEDFVIDLDKERFGRLLQTTLTQTANEQFQFFTPNGLLVPMHIGASRLDRRDGPMICLIGTDLSRLESQKELIELLNKQQKELDNSRIAALNLMNDAVESKKKTEETLIERKRAETELRRSSEELAVVNKELESFSYSVSHDLRAPLRSIKSFSSILQEDYSDKLDAAGKDFLKRIALGADKMNELIEDLLGLAKISREKMNPDKIDLGAIASSIIDDLRLAEPERKIETIIAPELIAFGDARLMKIALSNLIGNAWKYSGMSSKARIELGAVKKSDEKTYFIRDNGVGFDMAHSQKLFIPFHRLHSDNQFPGTGIGLAIVNKIIKRHNGRIWGEGETGKGSTFYFTLTIDAHKRARGE
jgi:PAS domain S-box-containing protein